MNERLILVTNDDGYDSRGIAAAIEVARRFGRVVVVAPETMQSGMSQAITMYSPLYLRRIREEEDVRVYAFSGTPVDCVKMAFDYLLRDERVDLVISGINHGSNSAANVLYSGTMGAAIEGSFYGCPAVGLSLDDHSADADFAGAVEYGYYNDDVTVEVIGDGIHVPESLLRLIFKIKGADRIALVTDSMRAAGMPDGRYVLGSLSGGQEVIVEDGVAKLPDRTAFAGSVATMDRAVRTVARLTGRPIAEIVRCATEIPAGIMGISDRKGSLRRGYDADIVVFDENVDVLYTIVGGQIVYDKSKSTRSC